MKNTHLRKNKEFSAFGKTTFIAALSMIAAWMPASGVMAEEEANQSAAVYALQQEKKTVTGLITDEDGNPIPGATVVVQGTANGVTTDIEGRYTLSNVKAGDLIEYRFIGFNTETREYKNESTLNIRLIEASVGLEDVVVIGYGQQKKESVVSSINTISSEELQMPGRSLSNNLAGQIAGVLAVQRSGEPGKDNSSFWIRGMSSFAGGTSPLVLVTAMSMLERML